MKTSSNLLAKDTLSATSRTSTSSSETIQQSHEESKSSLWAQFCAEPKINPPAWRPCPCPCSISVSALRPAGRPPTAQSFRLWPSARRRAAAGSLQTGQRTPWGCRSPASRRLWGTRRQGVTPRELRQTSYCEALWPCTTVASGFQTGMSIFNEFINQ